MSKMLDSSRTYSRNRYGRQRVLLLWPCWAFSEPCLWWYRWLSRSYYYYYAEVFPRLAERSTPSSILTLRTARKFGLTIRVLPTRSRVSGKGKTPLIILRPVKFCVVPKGKQEALSIDAVVLPTIANLLPMELVLPHITQLYMHLHSGGRSVPHTVFRGTPPRGSHLSSLWRVFRNK